MQKVACHLAGLGFGDFVFLAVGEGFFFVDAGGGDGGVAALATGVGWLGLVVRWWCRLRDVGWHEKWRCAGYLRVGSSAVRGLWQR